MANELRGGVACLEQTAAAITALANPSAGKRLLVPGADGWYEKTSAGVVSKVGPVDGGNPDPVDLGYKAWAFDPVATQSTSTLTAGVLYVVRLWVRQPTTISSGIVYVFTAGATLTNVGFALYTAAGALLTSSVNANGATAAAFQSTGLKTVTFTTQTIAAGAFYLALWTTGTTQPALIRAINFSALINGALVAPNLRFASANTGLTTTAPATMGTQTALGAALWAAAA